MTNRHRILMENRSKLTVSEVSEVYSFDETVVNLQIGGDVDLTISGDGLTITKLALDAPEGGEVVICGNIEALVYSEQKRQSKKDGSERRTGLFGIFK